MLACKDAQPHRFREHLTCACLPLAQTVTNVAEQRHHNPAPPQLCSTGPPHESRHKATKTVPAKGTAQEQTNAHTTRCMKSCGKPLTTHLACKAATSTAKVCTASHNRVAQNDTHTITTPPSWHLIHMIHHSTPHA